MLRTVLLFFFLLGFVASEVQAAPAAAASRPIHRRKPAAGNYVPVYKLYRGHSRRHRGLFGWFRHRATARHNAAKAQKSRGHRGTL